MNNNNSKIYKAAIYLRLSREDECTVDGSFKSESNSITNQRMLIQKFILGVSDISQVKECVDDGFSGSNFDRPGFKQMITDIKAGRVNCVIVKDLSRFGRDFIGSGQYMSKMFPELGVRFIAINDHYDSLTADVSETGLTLPVKNIINDSYSRDISQKIKGSKHIKRMNGDFVGSFAVYGYKKCMENRNKLEVDKETVAVVSDIFAMKLSGLSALAIANRLKALGVVSPLEYKKSKSIKMASGFKQEARSSWSSPSVTRILKDETYTGTLLQGKSEKINYKVKKSARKPKEEWIRCEDNHPGIISRSDYEAVQLLLARDTRTLTSKTEPYMFAGMLFCGDCGNSMVRRKNKYKDNISIYYVYSSYNRFKTCERHSIKEAEIEQIVLGELQRHIDAMVNVYELTGQIKDIHVDVNDVLRFDAEIIKLKQEEKKLLQTTTALLVDFRDGLVDEIQYEKYSKIYADKKDAITVALESQEKLIKEIYEKSEVVTTRLSMFKQHLKIEKLDRLALVTFIDRIMIFDDKRIEIVFKFQRELVKAKAVVITMDSLKKSVTELPEGLVV